MAALPKQSPAARLKNLFLPAMGIVGTIFAACEGIDGVTSVLSMLGAHGLALAIPAIIYAAVSVILFYGFDMLKISKALDIPLLKTQSELRATIDLTSSLENAYSLIKEKAVAIQYVTNEEQHRELHSLAQAAQRLDQHYEELQSRQNKLQVASSDKPAKRIIHGVLGVIAAPLFGGMGFFTGQGAAVFIAGALALSNPVTFGLCITLGIIGSLSALGSYLFLEFSGIRKLLNAISGLPAKPIEQLQETFATISERRKDLYRHFDAIELSTHVYTETLTTQEKLEAKTDKLGKLVNGLDQESDHHALAQKKYQKLTQQQSALNTAVERMQSDKVSAHAMIALRERQATCRYKQKIIKQLEPSKSVSP